MKGVTTGAHLLSPNDLVHLDLLRALVLVMSALADLTSLLVADLLVTIVGS